MGYWHSFHPMSWKAAQNLGMRSPETDERCVTVDVDVVELLWDYLNFIPSSHPNDRLRWEHGLDPFGMTWISPQGAQTATRILTAVEEIFLLGPDRIDVLAGSRANRKGTLLVSRKTTPAADVLATIRSLRDLFAQAVNDSHHVVHCGL